MQKQDIESVAILISVKYLERYDLAQRFLTRLIFIQKSVKSTLRPIGWPMIV